MEPEANRNWLLIIALVLFAGLAAVLILRGSGSNPDALGDDANLSQVEPQAVTGCAGDRITDQIRTKLFTDAAAMRGRDQEEYQQLAGRVSVRMESAVSEGEDIRSGDLNCTGSIAIDLPQPIATAAGRDRLMADLDFVVAPQSGTVVSFRNADALIASLAGLNLEGTTQPQNPLAPGDENAVADELPDPLAPTPPARPKASPPMIANEACAKLRSQAERMICTDPRLEQLDQQAAEEFSRALSVASPQQIDLLQQTRSRFTAYRNGCADQACIAAAYNDRIREIRDILSNRWNSQR